MTFETLSVFASLVNVIFIAIALTRFVRFVSANRSLIWGWMKEDSYWLVPAVIINLCILVILL